MITYNYDLDLVPGGFLFTLPKETGRRCIMIKGNIC